jgi:hypothetical protein
VEVYFFQPLLYIKAWAGFSDPWEVTMADDFGIGIGEGGFIACGLTYLLIHKEQS